MGYGGNTEFFQKAAFSTLTFKDIFSEVFKTHNKKDGEMLFMAGTSLTTPAESEMLSGWKRPWLFAWIGGVGLLFVILMFFLVAKGYHHGIVPLIFAGALVIPLSVLLFFWEMNIPRNIPIYDVVFMLLIGGAASLIFTTVLIGMVGELPPYWAPLTEEPAKLLALCLFLRKPNCNYILNGILIGAAIGTGFAAIESMGYALQSNEFGTLLTRGLLSPGGHVAWAALYGGALAQVKGYQKLQPRHFTEGGVLLYFAIAFALHFLWNSDIALAPVPLFGDLKFVLLVLAAWIALLNMMKKGVQQVISISASPVARKDYEYPLASLRGLSGPYQGQFLPISHNNLVFGRNPRQANILYPASTPGISSVHCEIRNERGKIMLVDLGSSYGTFLSNGTQLAPHVPYALHRGEAFYLANRNHQFELT